MTWDTSPLTVRPRMSLRRPLIEEVPPRGLEHHVSLECSQALVHWGELAGVPSAERGASRRIVGVELEEAGKCCSGCARKEELVHVGAKFFLGPIRSRMVSCMKSHTGHCVGCLCGNLRDVEASDGEESAFVQDIAYATYERSPRYRKAT